LKKSVENISLITFGNFEYDFLDLIAKEIGIEFNLPVKLVEGEIDITEFYDPSRRQYDGNKVLKAVEEKYIQSNIKTIALFQIDLFIPILTFIFGQAYLNGNIGIASLYRLKNERYGMPPDENLLRERFVKEIIHELGHTMGLIHCHTPTCVMRSSTYVEEIDQKGAAFCKNCNDQLNG